MKNRILFALLALVTGHDFAQTVFQKGIHFLSSPSQGTIDMKRTSDKGCILLLVIMVVFTLGDTE